MPATRKIVPAAAGLLIVGAVAWTFWPKQDASKQGRTQVQTVKTAVAEQKPIPVTIRSNGYVVALHTVEVRPQTQNIVRSVHVKEGQDVRAGQLLFTLDQRVDAANLDKSQAQVLSDRAELAEAESALARNLELQAKGFVAQAVVDTSRAKVAALRGALKANQAAVQSSNVTLGNNQIAASIDGRLGAISVHPGSLAQPSGQPLVTIAQIDPIAVGFTVPERELGHIMTSYPKGEAPVIAKLADGKEVEGKLFFIDNAADPQTGTVKMKAQFANAERRMWPGSFVTVRLVSRTLPSAVAVPAQAIVTSPDEKFVYLVQEDETVRKQRVEVIAIEDGIAATSGLAAGARIVVEGAQNLRPSAKVKEASTAPPGEGGKKKGNKADKGKDEKTTKAGK
jgi:RND family efflux transporter MFP subunit